MLLLDGGNLRCCTPYVHDEEAAAQECGRHDQHPAHDVNGDHAHHRYGDEDGHGIA